MRVLITGGYGFIGMYATARLRGEGHEIFIFDTLPAAPAGMEKEFEGTTAIRGDLLNPLSLMEALRQYKIEAIIHLAALRNNDSGRFPHAAFKLNCEGTMNCFEAARILGIKRVCYASSIAVYGGFELYKKTGFDADLLSEEAPPRPTNVYGATKLFCEMMGEEYSKSYGLDIIGVRLPIIFGAGKKGGSRSSFYNELIEGPAAGRPVTVRVPAKEKFNVQYVKDSGKAVVCGCLAPPGTAGVYNTGGQIVTMEEYITTIKSLYPAADITLVDDPAGTTVSDTCLDSSLAKREIGYAPDYTLRQGMEDYIKALA